jgi:GR25 family glycosyltransferase involved in LPS biosynthesis
MKSKLFKSLSLWNRKRLEKRRHDKLNKRIHRARNTEIAILSPKHCLSLAQELKEYLRQVGKRSIVTTNEKKVRGKFTIVICPQVFHKLPNKYISIQMEQSINSRWFTEDYLARLSKSAAVIDYSKSNLRYLLDKGLPFQKLYYMPILPNFAETSESCHDREIDVLFYGDTNNPRRKYILDELSKNFNIKVINNVFGAELLDNLRSAKIVLNIHYYEGALLETVRISESMNNGAIVISERSADEADYPEITSLIDFVDNGDVLAMKERISYWLDNNQRREQRAAEISSTIKAKGNSTRFHFLRAILALDIISFDSFYSACSDDFKLPSNKVCLSMPESLERRVSFDKENCHGFHYFPGLRHSLGWVGCGLSYKFLLRKARQEELNCLTICEDDTGFHPEHETSIQAIHDYLSQQKWDLFSGFMADVDQTTKFHGSDFVGGMHFIQMDRMVSTVFNIYNRSFFEVLENWNPDIRDAKYNTVDRFIQRCDNLRIVTTIPFLVDHKEELDSTLWGFNNSTYHAMVHDATNKLLAATGKSY